MGRTTPNPLGPGHYAQITTLVQIKVLGSKKNTCAPIHRSVTELCQRMGRSTSIYGQATTEQEKTQPIRTWTDAFHGPMHMILVVYKLVIGIKLLVLLDWRKSG